ncbi:MAG: hypothetical protein ABII72_01125 [Parcubacteria group bacterium]
MNWLESLQEKSRPEKNKLLWIAAGVITVMVIVIWISAIPKDYLKKQEVTGPRVSDLKGALQESFSGTEYNELQDNINKLKNVSDEVPKPEEMTEDTNQPMEESSTIKPENRLPLEE